MWKEIWDKRRKQVMGALGAAGFLAAGLIASLALPPREDAAVLQTQAQTKRSAPQGASKKEREQKETRQEEPRLEDLRLEERAPAPQPPAPNWYLYITGSVRKPGVYQLPPGSRLFQLVDAAGGLDGFADRVAVNLAEPLADGLHVHVPRKGERAQRSGAFEDEIITVLTPGPQPRLGFQAPGAAPSRGTGRADGLIDINRASVETLTGLRGIGPTLARRIVEHRQRHGPFRSVEDLVQVQGIGAAKIKGLRGQAIAGP